MAGNKSALLQKQEEREGELLMAKKELADIKALLMDSIEPIEGLSQ